MSKIINLEEALKRKETVRQQEEEINIIDVPDKIEIPASNKFKEHSLKLSDFIKDLNLPNEINDKLVYLIVENVNIAKKDGFDFGFQMAIDVLDNE